MKHKTNEKGFTIIEVLIVLAIAALILLIVFLAVPALQRSARNTGRRSDGSRWAASINEFVSNNNGNLPATTADCTTINTSVGTQNQYGSNTLCTTPAAAGPAAITASNTYLATNAGAYTPPAATTNVMIIAEQATCNGAGATSAGTARQIALMYTLESGTSSWTWACIPAQ